jgi:hypothetical protein
MNSRREVIERAARHYVKRLQEVIGDKDDELKTDIVKSDLLTHAKEAEQLPLTKEFLSSEERQILCFALECYFKDLEQSKIVVKKKLGGENLTFKLVGEEISMVTAARDEICKSN